jgi:hypothetical protein
MGVKYSCLDKNTKENTVDVDVSNRFPKENYMEIPNSQSPYK